MAVDHTVQVALIAVITTTITTAGVIAVAIINGRKEKNNPPTPTPVEDAGLSQKEILKLIESLIRENARKETEIQELKEELKTLRSRSSPPRRPPNGRGKPNN